METIIQSYYEIAVNMTGSFMREEKTKMEQFQLKLLNTVATFLYTENLISIEERLRFLALIQEKR